MKTSIIKVSNLDKDFRLPHQRLGTVKSLFTNLFSLGNNSYETQHALRNITFEVKEGEFFGIVGRNGSGKSTLLKILASIYQPTRGSVEVKGRVVPFIELGVGFNGELTGRENVFLNGALMGFSEKEISIKYEDIVSFAGLERFMDQKLKNYSSGMQVRLAFSVATRLSESDILLVDEVLAVGDADFQRKCFTYFKGIKKEGKTVIFVSHDMNAIREYCDRAILIEKNELVASGTPESVATMYSKMFMDQSKYEQVKGKDSKRWGDGSLKYTKVKIKNNITDVDKHVVLLTEVIVNRNTDNPIFGFMIKNGAGNPVLGTNTQIKKKFFNSKKGQKLTIKWSIPNIFSDGVYFVDPAILYNSGSETADWIEEADEFRVLKEEKTPYMITPDISVDISENQNEF